MTPIRCSTCDIYEPSTTNRLTIAIKIFPRDSTEFASDDSKPEAGRQPVAIARETENDPFGRTSMGHMPLPPHGVAEILMLQKLKSNCDGAFSATESPSVSSNSVSAVDAVRDTHRRRHSKECMTLPKQKQCGSLGRKLRWSHRLSRRLGCVAMCNGVACLANSILNKIDQNPKPVIASLHLATLK